MRARSIAVLILAVGLSLTGTATAASTGPCRTFMAVGQRHPQLVQCQRGPLGWQVASNWHPTVQAPPLPPPPPPMSTGVVSWYDDTGATASGQHYTYGFAACGYGQCVPMGTRVEFCYHGRCAVGMRDDSGPYIGGRDWDLNQTLAAAIGMQGAGVATVSYRVL